MATTQISARVPSETPPPENGGGDWRFGQTFGADPPAAAAARGWQPGGAGGRWLVGYELHPDAEQAPAPAAAEADGDEDAGDDAGDHAREAVRLSSGPEPSTVTITQLASGTADTTPRFIALAPDNVIQNSTPGSRDSCSSTVSAGWCG